MNSLETLCSDFDSGDEDEDCREGRRRLCSKRGETANDPDGEGQFFVGVITWQRPEEDLVGYNVFFRELGDLRSQLFIVYSAYADKMPGQLNAAEEESRAKTLKLAKPRESRSSSFVGDRSNGNDTSRRLKILERVAGNVEDDRLAYCLVASAVRSVIPFAKVAYPDLVGGDGQGNVEPLNNKDRKVCRSKLLTCVDRGLHPGSMMHETVYNLDALASVPRQFDCTNEDSSIGANVGFIETDNRRLGNWDEKRVGKRCNDTKQLQFESRFESGNLRKAIRVGIFFTCNFTLLVQDPT